MRYLYVLSILFSFGGLLLLDWRYRVALFWRWRTALKLVLASFAFLLVWDLALVGSGLYWTKPQYVSGWYVGTPNLPVEELGFLLFLSYLTLLLWRWRWPRTS
jgi:lycopene cyclase domain-containing protein